MQNGIRATGNRDGGTGESKLEAGDTASYQFACASADKTFEAWEGCVNRVAMGTVSGGECPQQRATTKGLQCGN